MQPLHLEDDPCTSRRAIEEDQSLNKAIEWGSGHSNNCLTHTALEKYAEFLSSNVAIYESGKRTK